ncbi:MAG TPA: L,D-transpeptidase family protein [bacterium]|nr:L,D-transpeptidase family protein [bacterium]
MNRRVFTASLAASLALLARPRLARADIAAASLRDATERVRTLAKAQKLAFPLAHPSVRIRKKERILELRDGDVVLKTCSIALGHSPEGPKTIEGDMHTPEGRYFICYRNEQSQFHLFLGLSYPNAADAEAGRKAGTIDAATAKRIAAAEKAGEKPDWYTRLGGAVGIHGGGTGSDWTWGCIALDEADVDELWAACPEGTPVEILP